MSLSKTLYFLSGIGPGWDMAFSDGTAEFNLYLSEKSLKDKRKYWFEGETLLGTDDLSPTGSNIEMIETRNMSDTCLCYL